ncbi:hypothetical protein PHYPO_G00078900 [Pangasianodon hypophthalmus]|uniref:Uncharacterized protein n=1 Tax=Pangasianodon hypophthalmus TaxID=310915 RepID=A0A5N5LL59_PANHP|nr:hypothetical protein PHYPO_G00078900 [Pangasianodon hypophthalmus]
MSLIGVWPGNCTKVCRNCLSARHIVRMALHTVAFPTCSASPTSVLCADPQCVTLEMEGFKMFVK